MSDHDDGDRRQHDDVRQPGAGRRLTRAIAGGAVGLAVLGGGAYTLTSQLSADRGRPAAQPGPHAADISAAPGAAPGPAASSLAPDVRAKIDEARRSMAEHGVQVRRPIVPSATATAADVRVSTTGAFKKGGVARIVTARGDLTGQRELAWVAGGIAEHGGVPCSQTIRLSADLPPQKKNNLLICWRTSATKSVISIVVDPDGHPSAGKAVAALEQKWRSMS